MNGHIYIDRKILEWEWYKDINTKTLFLHLLIVASWRDTKWRGMEVKRGQVITSLASLAEGTGLTVREVRTALEHLVSTQEIDKVTTRKYSVITILNYDKYQNPDKETTSEMTKKRQTNDKLTTTSEEYKEDEEDKKDKSTNVDLYSTDYERIKQMWNELDGLGNIKGIRSIGDGKRRDNLRARLKTYTVDDFRTAIENIKRSKFLQGGNKNGWYIKFDWFILPSNFPKVLEGNYNDSQNEPYRYTGD